MAKSEKYFKATSTDKFKNYVRQITREVKDEAGNVTGVEVIGTEPVPAGYKLAFDIKADVYKTVEEMEGEGATLSKEEMRKAVNRGLVQSARAAAFTVACKAVGIIKKDASNDWEMALKKILEGMFPGKKEITVKMRRRAAAAVGYELSEDGLTILSTPKSRGEETDEDETDDSDDDE